MTPQTKYVENTKSAPRNQITTLFVSNHQTTLRWASEDKVVQMHSFDDDDDVPWLIQMRIIGVKVSLMQNQQVVHSI